MSEEVGKVVVVVEKEVEEEDDDEEEVVRPMMNQRCISIITM